MRNSAPGMSPEKIAIAVAVTIAAIAGIGAMNNVTGTSSAVAIVAVAALNLVLDFDVIDRGARSGAPAYMEWYAAFGLLVTLVWLYLELLRLLGRLRER